MLADLGPQLGGCLREGASMGLNALVGTGFDRLDVGLELLWGGRPRDFGGWVEGHIFGCWDVSQPRE